VGGPAYFSAPPPFVDPPYTPRPPPPPLLFDDLDTKIFFRVVKAGFAGRRKKLRGSLAAGLGVDKAEADKILGKAGIDGDLRAQNLSLSDWHKLYTAVLK
jgi:16S rRNA A1518/A1519 N6-dimethyltransferase RsmA/KsgA/DIM1 with predicted DNA glycosylase/AP lyase activity